MRLPNLLLTMALVFATACGTARKSNAGRINNDTTTTDDQSNLDDSPSNTGFLNNNNSGNTNTTSSTTTADGELTTSNAVLSSSAKTCSIDLAASIVMMAPATGKAVVNGDTLFEIRVSGCTGVYRVQGYSPKFSSSAVLLKKYAAAGNISESLVIESLDASDKVAATKTINTGNFDVVASQIAVNNGLPASNIAPVISGYKVIPFSQSMGYCSPNAGFMQGRISFYNSGTSAVNIEVSATLEYALGVSIPQIDTSGVTLVVPAGGFISYRLANTANAYACIGLARFYGKIKIPNGASVTADGSMLTQIAPGEYANVPFTVSSTALTAIAPFGSSRQAGFSQNFTYCNAELGFLQGMVLVYNPHDTATTATVSGMLTYQSAAGVVEQETFTFTTTLSANTAYYGGISSKKKSYGCGANANLTGSVTAQSPINYLQASGNVLTTASNASKKFMNIPFVVSAAAPF